MRLWLRKLFGQVSRDRTPHREISSRLRPRQKIRCAHHGVCTGMGLVCTHVAHAIDHGDLVGFYWGTETDFDRPDAWCHDCNEKRKNPGITTEDEWYRQGEFKVLCEHCWDEAKRVCGGVRD